MKREERCGEHEDWSGARRRDKTEEQRSTAAVWVNNYTQEREKTEESINERCMEL